MKNSCLRCKHAGRPSGIFTQANYNNQKPPPVYMRRPISISTESEKQSGAAARRVAYLLGSCCCCCRDGLCQCRPSDGAPLRPRPMHQHKRKTHARAFLESGELDARVSWSSQALASETVRCGWKISPEAELSRLSESGQQHTRTPRTIHSHTKSKSAARCGGPASTHTRELQVYYAHQMNRRTNLICWKKINHVRAVCG